MADRTPLAPDHEARGAKFTEFGGWEMPVSFDSIASEHRAVRERAGKFDVSHMGRIEVSGPDAEALMQRLTTNDVTALAPGEAHYAMITDERGVILDDTVVYRLDEGFLFVPNAGKDRAMADRWRDHRDERGLDASVGTVTRERAMLAVQGPGAADLVAAEASRPEVLRELSRFEHADATVAGADCLASRTGYTGEDGFELVCPRADAGALWAALDCRPCGLGARDTLRIEMGYLLSGQEFDPETEPRTPYEAGVGFTVALETGFVGSEALRGAADPDQRLTGLRLLDRGVPRHGHEVTDGAGDAVGHVTSGTMSPTLDEPVGLAYLPAGIDPGTQVRVSVRDRQKRATVVSPPFIDR